MSRPRVKICGLTRREDVEAAVAAGADALGFICWPNSPRFVPPRAVRALAADLPALVARVGVFVGAPPDEVRDTVGAAGLAAVQLHGDEAVGDYAVVGRPLIRAVSLLTDEDVARAVELPAAVTVLVDAHDPARRGGTGTRADWRRAAALARRRPILLAGGLGPENVAEALHEVRPWGIDVSSGVETALA
ncbi:MAG: phosphoribosylanthranilate isomerase [Vicinamibacterales bacterium]